LMRRFTFGNVLLKSKRLLWCIFSPKKRSGF
jgi:hypothetical protein